MNEVETSDVKELILSVKRDMEIQGARHEILKEHIEDIKTSVKDIPILKTQLETFGSEVNKVRAKLENGLTSRITLAEAGIADVKDDLTKLEDSHKEVRGYKHGYKVSIAAIGLTILLTVGWDIAKTTWINKSAPIVIEPKPTAVEDKKPEKIEDIKPLQLEPPRIEKPKYVSKKKQKRAANQQTPVQADGIVPNKFYAEGVFPRMPRKEDQDNRRKP